MNDILTKLKSDRLWVLLAYATLIIVNAAFNLGVTEEQLTLLAFAVITFIAGKSWRATGIGAAIEAITPAVVKTANRIAEEKIPDVPSGDENKADGV